MFDNKSSLNTIMLGGIIILLIMVMLRNSPNYAVAQGDGGAGAKHVFALIGKPERNRQPLYLVDTRQEVIMVYEYGVQSEGLGLVAARSYKYDKLLEDYGRSTFGPKVKEVKETIEK